MEVIPLRIPLTLSITDNRCCNMENYKSLIGYNAKLSAPGVPRIAKKSKIQDINDNAEEPDIQAIAISYTKDLSQTWALTRTNPNNPNKTSHNRHHKDPNKCD